MSVRMATGTGGGDRGRGPEEAVYRRAVGAGSSSKWLRLGATAVAAVVLAEAAAWLLRPRDVVEPVQVDESAYFPKEEIARARDYASGQRLLLVGSLVAEGAVLVLLATGRPAATRRVLERLGARPVLGGAAAAAGLSVVVAVATVPFGIAAHERSVDVGLSTQSLGGWAIDWVKGSAIAAILAGLVGTVALGLMRRFGGRWWIPGSVGVVLGAAVITWLAPVVLAPLFNKFEPLEPGRARDDVVELADRAGVDVGEVYRVDASRRTTAINAYVNGLGPSKRVVLYDTLIDDLDRGERRSVIAHELGRVGVPARLRSRGRGHLVRDRRRRQSALSGSRGARRHLLAGAHRRPEGPDRAPAAARRTQHLRSGSPWFLQLPVPDPPARGRADRDRPSLGVRRAPLNVTVIAV